LIFGTGTETFVLDFAEAIWKTTNTNSETVHTDPRPADIDHSVADISKARKQFCYEPQVSLLDGIGSVKHYNTSIDVRPSTRSGVRSSPPPQLSISSGTVVKPSVRKSSVSNVKTCPSNPRARH
jgi:hypothetical protein